MSCKSCVHWDQPSWVGTLPVHGVCKRVGHHRHMPTSIDGPLDDWTDEEKEDYYDYSKNVIFYENNVAIVVDGSGYFAALKTRGDFSCCLYSSKFLQKIRNLGRKVLCYFNLCRHVVHVPKPTT